jgi:ABC-type multidrug transport system fused ATPase/permease subunit
MTVGLLLVFMDYIRKLWEPMKWLTEFFAKVRIHEAAARRVFRILDMPEAITEAPDAESLAVCSRSLVLDHVGFEYRPGHPVLRDLCAEIQPGEMVAFVGPSGSGKSTLLALMLRPLRSNHRGSAPGRRRTSVRLGWRMPGPIWRLWLRTASCFQPASRQHRLWAPRCEPM